MRREATWLFNTEVKIIDGQGRSLRHTNSYTGYVDDLIEPKQLSSLCRLIVPEEGKIYEWRPNRIAWHLIQGPNQKFPLGSADPQNGQPSAPRDSQGELDRAIETIREMSASPKLEKEEVKSKTHLEERARKHLRNLFDEMGQQLSSGAKYILRYNMRKFGFTPLHFRTEHLLQVILLFILDKDPRNFRPDQMRALEDLVKKLKSNDEVAWYHSLSTLFMNCLSVYYVKGPALWYFADLSAMIKHIPGLSYANMGVSVMATAMHLCSDFVLADLPDVDYITLPAKRDDVSDLERTLQMIRDPETPSDNKEDLRWTLGCLLAGMGPGPIPDGRNERPFIAGRDSETESYRNVIWEPSIPLAEPYARGRAQLLTMVLDERNQKLILDIAQETLRRFKNNPASTRLLQQGEMFFNEFTDLLGKLPAHESVTIEDLMFRPEDHGGILNQLKSPGLSHEVIVARLKAFIDRYTELIKNREQGVVSQIASTERSSHISSVGFFIAPLWQCIFFVSVPLTVFPFLFLVDSLSLTGPPEMRIAQQTVFVLFGAVVGAFLSPYTRWIYVSIHRVKAFKAARSFNKNLTPKSYRRGLFVLARVFDRLMFAAFLFFFIAPLLYPDFFSHSWCFPAQPTNVLHLVLQAGVWAVLIKTLIHELNNLLFFLGLFRKYIPVPGSSPLMEKPDVATSIDNQDLPRLGHRLDFEAKTRALIRRQA